VHNAVNTGAFITNSTDGGINARMQNNNGGGNTRSMGEVYLEVGEYPIQYQWFEGTGGSNFEALASLSDAPGRIIRPIMTATAAALTNIAVGPYVNTSGITLVDTNIRVTSLNLTGNQFTFGWVSLPDVRYIIESSSDMQVWTVENNDYPSAGTNTTYTTTVDTTNPSKKFWRARHK
jgi:hypothetical protein